MDKNGCFVSIQNREIWERLNLTAKEFEAFKERYERRHEEIEALISKVYWIGAGVIVLLTAILVTVVEKNL